MGKNTATASRKPLSTRRNISRAALGRGRSSGFGRNVVGRARRAIANFARGR